MPLSRELLGPLHERPFRLLWFGRTASAFGDSLVGVALAFAVFEVGGGASGLGLVLAAFTLGRVAFILAGGVWAERLPRRFVMIACDVVRGAVDVFVAVALLTGFMELWMFFLTASVFGAASSFFVPASTGLVPHTVSPHRLQQANALLSLSNNGAGIFGPALSGVLIALTAPGWVFAVDALTFALSGAALAMLRVAARPPALRRHFVAELGEGWREIWSRGWMRAGLLAAGVANIGIGVFFLLGPLVAAERLGGSAAWGVVLTGGAIGGVAGGALAYRLRPSRPLLACFVAWSFGVLPSLALMPPVPALALALAYGGFVLGIAYGNTVWETVVQREIPADRLSRVSSFDWLVSLAFMPLGQALAGPLADAVGRNAVLAAAAGLIAFASVAGLLSPSVRRVRGEVPAPAPAARPAA